jgi:hypothetical protein
VERELLAAGVPAPHGAFGGRVVLDVRPTLHDLPPHGRVEEPVPRHRLGGVARADGEEGAHENEEE